MKRLAIIGSTGSIGTTTLNVARHLAEEISIEAIAAHSNIVLLEKQAREFHPKLIAVFDPDAALKLQKRLPKAEIVAGMEGLKAVASFSSANFVISAISGAIGLEPTMAAILAGKDVGLANKEALITGGALVTAAVRTSGIKLMPIDSEHSAIFQCLEGENRNSLSRIILTASGGPFRNFNEEQLAAITVADALKHPTWNMGAKITIDCSTLMNKGLEMIEARWLFDIDPENIDVVIHPQSIIHSMVEFIDGSIIAQMSKPSMAVPIQYAITHPERVHSFHPPFDFKKMSTLELSPPNLEKFPCLRLAYEAIKIGGSMPCFMNAVNEELVGEFIKGRLSWQGIAAGVEDLMSSHQIMQISSLEEIFAIDAIARREAADFCQTKV
ncbi:MAG: 1-deoxy-D-xylulose-5-phosphate reductoisomerase [Parachlamydiaceae bacterium]|nr:1-deoxy-D-xylulose-5-phosphate reductoisomerase [Parachlamydiaceae bacterium]